MVQTLLKMISLLTLIRTIEKLRIMGENYGKFGKEIYVGKIKSI